RRRRASCGGCPRADAQLAEPGTGRGRRGCRACRGDAEDRPAPHGGLQVLLPLANGQLLEQVYRRAEPLDGCAIVRVVTNLVRRERAFELRNVWEVPLGAQRWIGDGHTHKPHTATHWRAADAERGSARCTSPRN